MNKTFRLFGLALVAAIAVCVAHVMGFGVNWRLVATGIAVFGVSVFNWEAAWSSKSGATGGQLTTELNSLAVATSGSTGVSTAASAYDNTGSTDLDQYGAFQLAVDFASAPTAGGSVEVYANETLDGSNYAPHPAIADLGTVRYLGSIQIPATAAAFVVASPWTFLMRPGKMKFIVVNRTDQAFPASGSTLTLFVTNDESQ